jgi:3-hydroxyanthranilate 3,4-dioxygenase
MTEYPSPFSINEWIAEHRELLRPPVANRMLFDDKSGMIVQVIGGGNERVDFHDDPAQEFFFQLKGDMILKVYQDREIRSIRIREGDVFLLPAHVPHSPQRPDPESVGLVVEGKREPGMLDGFEWYCFECGDKVGRVEIRLKDIVADLPPLFDSFYQDVDRRTCGNCGTVHPGRTPPAGWVDL